MKKTSQKLTLARETLRLLDLGTLKAVEGGLAQQVGIVSSDQRECMTTRNNSGAC
ncbi:MAG TPA: hypothetical protein VGH73_02050 [Thermoanaerobaculia bacterium]